MRHSPHRAIAALLLAFGVWGLVAPYLARAVGLAVPVAAKVEVVDHVVPGIVVLAVAVLSLLMRRIALVSALLATLAGFWMTATHISLLVDAEHGRASFPAALIHSLPGIIILILSIAAAVIAWGEEAEPAE